WKMPADGGEAAPLSMDVGLMPFESPDGKSVFYVHPPPEKGIWKIPAQGGEAVQVTGPIAKAQAFAVSNEGIYYPAPPESPHRHLSMFHDFAPGRARPVVVADHEIGFSGMSLSPDGRYLIFAQRDQAGSDLVLSENVDSR